MSRTFSKGARGQWDLGAHKAHGDWVGAPACPIRQAGSGQALTSNAELRAE